MTRSTSDALARGLGFFSLALGATELLASRAICRTLGLEGRENLVRAYGAREIATGIAILASRDPTPWILGRVAGDALDIATVATGLKDDNPKQGNVIATIGVLVGATGLDAICAAALLSSDPSLETARSVRVPNAGVSHVLGDGTGMPSQPAAGPHSRAQVARPAA